MTWMIVYIKADISILLLSQAVLLLSGFVLRWVQLERIKRKVLHLEDKMLADHAEILRLQQELAIKSTTGV